MERKLRTETQKKEIKELLYNALDNNKSLILVSENGTAVSAIGGDLMALGCCVLDAIEDQMDYKAVKAVWETYNECRDGGLINKIKKIMGESNE